MKRDLEKKKPLRALKPVAVALTLLMPGPVFAHLVNTAVGEFYGGMMHPLTSAEHLLPILALGVLASQSGRRSARVALIGFPLALMAGIGIGSQLPAMTAVRVVNLALLIVLGGLLMGVRYAVRGVVATVAAATGLILGWRSGVDMAAAGVGFQFLPGVTLTGLILVALAAAWIPEATSKRSCRLRSLLGGVFAAAGILMVLTALADVDLRSVRGVGLPGEQDLLAMMQGKDLSVSVVLATLAGAMIWGAGHALTPGHGKAIVAAYLVGARSTPWHAVYLAITVTATHTLTIFALGLVTLLGSRTILADQLYPWLSLVSGLIIVWIGAVMVVTRLRGLMRGAGHHHHIHVHSGHHHDHEHGAPGVHHHSHPTGDSEHGHSHHPHSHMPSGADGSPVTWRSLLGLGISGGLLPCPSALVLLLAAVSLGRTGLGMVLVAAFSTGLATVLIAVGLLFVKGGSIIGRTPRLLAAGRWLPAISASVILVIGTIITVGAMTRISL